MCMALPRWPRGKLEAAGTAHSVDPTRGRHGFANTTPSEPAPVGGPGRPSSWVKRKNRPAAARETASPLGGGQNRFGCERAQQTRLRQSGWSGCKRPGHGRAAAAPRLAEGALRSAGRSETPRRRTMPWLCPYHRQNHSRTHAPGVPGAVNPAHASALQAQQAAASKRFKCLIFATYARVILPTLLPQPLRVVRTLEWHY
jgi:hypothetical protein